MPFISENVFFSSDDTAQRLEESRSRVEPVVKQIERGDRIIKKGFIVSKDDMIRLRALGFVPYQKRSLPRNRSDSGTNARIRPLYLSGEPPGLSGDF